MQKITTFLWFDGKAEEAADFYVSIFKDSKVISTMGPKGSAMGVTFQLEGQEFIGLNGGPKYKFTPAISLFVNCETQAEVDELWGKLSDGQFEQCGWLQDKYGLSWQVVPDMLLELMRGPKAAKVMEAFMKMRKFDIATLKKAAA